MSCHICIYWTPQNGCTHYGPSIGNAHYKPMPRPELLSPEQRLAAYCYALTRVHIVVRPYICCLLRDYTYGLKIRLGPQVVDYFPEFAKHKPTVLPSETTGGTKWWVEEAVDIRKHVLRQCIEECLLLIKS